MGLLARGRRGGPPPIEELLAGPEVLLKDKEKWLELCALAAVEQDSEKLMALVKEIDRLLAEKEARLKAAQKPQESSAQKRAG